MNQQLFDMYLLWQANLCARYFPIFSKNRAILQAFTILLNSKIVSIDYYYFSFREICGKYLLDKDRLLLPCTVLSALNYVNFLFNFNCRLLKMSLIFFAAFD